jgi:hypothetical protein
MFEVGDRVILNGNRKKIYVVEFVDGRNVTISHNGKMAEVLEYELSYV